MTRSRAQMGFLQVFGEHDAITSGLPCHLQQSTIEVPHNPHNRHAFAWKMNFAAARISDHSPESCCSHDRVHAGFECRNIRPYRREK